MFAIARSAKADEKTGNLKYSRFHCCEVIHRDGIRAPCLSLFTNRERAMEFSVTKLSGEFHTVKVKGVPDLYSLLEKVVSNGIEWIIIDPYTPVAGHTEQVATIESLKRAMGFVK
jgi:hypothetical protein